MPITDIKDIQILPPMALARFGSSDEPLENYAAEVRDPIGFRALVPKPSFIVDHDSGEITGLTNPDPDSEVAFRDSNLAVKPLAPFLELWAQFEDGAAFEPLTIDHLAELGLTPGDLRWRLDVGNLKVFRRTGDVGDRVTATTDVFSDHARHELFGTCTHFKPGKNIPMGSIQFIKPTDDFKELRVRFTPGSGRVFGPREGDPHLTDDVYGGVTSYPYGQYDGEWDRYWAGKPGTNPVTAPADIYQGETVGNNKLSHGYFDDTCDGILRVSLAVDGKELSSYARVIATLPDFAPDSFIVRSIADDLEQIALGRDIDEPADAATASELKSDVEDTLRRAMETVRSINTMIHNGDQGIGGVEFFSNTMAGQQTGYGRAFEPVYAEPSDAEYRFVLSRHQTLLETALTSAELQGSFFGQDRMRAPENVAELGVNARRKMPALMRGSDGLELALTYRQLRKLELAGPAAPGGRLARPLDPESIDVRVSLPDVRTKHDVKLGGNDDG